MGDGPVSGYAMEWAAEMGEAKKLSPDARAVLVLGLAYWANRKSGWAWASRAEIAAKTGFGPHRVIRALAEVEAAGVIGVERRAGRTTRWGPFPTLAYPRDRTRDPEPEPGSTRATVRATTRATGGTTPARPGARDPLETRAKQPRAAAAQRGGSTWVATLPEPEPEPGAFTSEPEPYARCPVCGGIGFVVADGRRTVCRNSAAHRG